MNAGRYAPVTGEVVEELTSIVGDRFVVTDPEMLEPYSHDEVPGHGHMPEVVVKPRSTGEIAEIVKLANRRLIPITPRGAGSGLSGGAVPVFGGIVVSLERMNQILEVDEANMVVVVEPGVVTNDINERLEPLGLFYAGYPMSVETCFIGGNVAENAGGGKAIVKDVTGYNLVKLMVGSEGTLGIVTRIILRLMPLPESVVDLLVLFPDPESAIAVVPKIMSEGGCVPTAIEFMDQLSVRAACEYLNEQLPYEQAGAMLLIEVDGSDEEAVLRDYETIGELCLANQAQEVYVADNATTRERLWRVRRNIPEAFMGPYKSTEDVVLPPADIPKLIPELQRISAKYGVQIPCFGHAGDGNVHPKVVKLPEDSPEAWNEKLPKVLTELYQVTKELGGTMSGEHGVGSKRKQYLKLFASEAEMELIRSIKRAFDPNNIMNPGKIVDL